jgi:FAD/FMN-containing dehydrogenase
MTSAALPEIDDQMRRRIADQLSGRFKGDLIGPDHAEYRDRSTVWNAMVDKRPGLILRCTSTEDVAAAVNVARSNGLPPPSVVVDTTWRAGPCRTAA